MKKILVLSLCFVGIAYSQDFQITVPGKVQVMLISADGRRLGYSQTSDSVYFEIPNGGYTYGSIGSVDENDTSSPDDFYELYVNDTGLKGTFRLVIAGMYTTKYYVDISKGIVNHSASEKHSFIPKGGKEEFLLELGADSMVVTRKLGKETLRKDLDLAYQLGELGGKPLYFDLSNRVRKYEEWIQKDDTVKANHELGKLDKKLDEMYKKTKGPSKDPNHFIKEDAYRILKEDVMGLMK